MLAAIYRYQGSGTDQENGLAVVCGSINFIFQIRIAKTGCADARIYVFSCLIFSRVVPEWVDATLDCTNKKI